MLAGHDRSWGWMGDHREFFIGKSSIILAGSDWISAWKRSLRLSINNGCFAGGVAQR